MKTCQNCKHKAKGKANFCKKCGQKYSELVRSKLEWSDFFSQPILWITVTIIIILLSIILFSSFNRTANKETISQTSSKVSGSDTLSSTSDNSSTRDTSNENENVDWKEKDYIVISLFDKSTNKETVISAGFGLTISNSGTLVNVNDINGNYWGQEFIDDKIQVKTKNYGAGDHKVTIYNNDSAVATGENLCIDGGKTLLNVHPLMDLTDYTAQMSLKDSDIVSIQVD